MIDVRQIGAHGDGTTDDTAAIREAMRQVVEGGGGVVHFPPGRYRTDALRLPSHVTLRGEGSWSYRQAGASVLLPIREEQPCLIDLSHSKGGRLEGLSLLGELMGEAMHGVVVSRPRKRDRHDPRPKAVNGVPPRREERLSFIRQGDEPFDSDFGEQNIVVDNCWISLFTGSGIHLSHSHVWCVRHSLITYNGIDGIDGRESCDAWVIDNQVGFNGRFGIHIGSSTTITANRIEQNEQAGLKFNEFYVEDNVVTGNHFCSNRGTGIDLSRTLEHDHSNVRGVTITGNHLRNSGIAIIDEPDRCCHIRLKHAAGVTCTGNMLHARGSARGPTAAMVIEGLTDCVIQGNSFYKAATERMIRDRGGHQRLVIGDNPGLVKEAGDTTA